MTVYDAPSPSDIDGATDGVTVKLAKLPSLEGKLYLFQGWPTESFGVSTVVTTTDAIVPSPAADLDRQVEITAQKGAQVESFQVTLTQALTLWTGARTNDLTTL